MKGWFKREYLILGLIFGAGLIFRIYNFDKSFLFAHDQDLYSWIAKDIIDGHQRLVGQVTSVQGVFIGSAYYYLMAVFYKIFQMNPLGAIVPLILIGIFNIGSFGWFLKKHFSIKSSLIGMFIWATTYGICLFEKWSVPTEPTLTWSLWFLIVIFELYKGNLKFLPVYGFLVGFTWQLHIALLPILPIPIIAYFVGNNKFTKLFNKDNLFLTMMGIFALVITISPFIIFEIKHNFSQTRSMVNGINQDSGGPKGVQKFQKVIDASGREFQQRIFFGWEQVTPILMWLILIGFWLFILVTKKIDLRVSGLLLGWIFLIGLAQYISKRVVSEYYFSNLTPIYILVLTLFISNLGNKYVVTPIIIGLLVINSYWLMSKTDIDESYFYRKQLVDSIKMNVVNNGYNCVAINYIADPGVGVGFRYLLWYTGINLVKPGTKDVAIYNISIPWQLVAKENPIHYGRFGVLVPAKVKGLTRDECQKKEYQIDPLLGYTE